MLTFLGYTLAVLITIAAIPAGIAIGIYVFTHGIPSALGLVKNTLSNRKRDSIDIEIEDKQQGIQWLKEKQEKIALLSSLDEEERLLREDIDRESARLKESLLDDDSTDRYINSKDW